MLTPGINKAYQQGVARLAGTPKVEKIGSGRGAERPQPGSGRIVRHGRDARFRPMRALSEEVFGAASLVIRCPDIATMRAMAERLEGQLTATIQMDKDDAAERLHAHPHPGTPGRANPDQRLSDRRRGQPRDGAWRPLSRDLGRTHDIRRHSWRSGASCGPSATRTSRKICCRRRFGTPIRSTSGVAETVPWDSIRKSLFPFVKSMP